MSESSPKKSTGPINTFRIVQAIISILFLAILGWRLYTVIDSGVYGPETWVRFALSGLIIGSVYSVIAIGYTLVYGILFMINFAHGEIMMLGAFSGYFVFEILKSITVDQVTGMSFLDSYQILSVVLAFIVGMTIAAVSGYFLERIAYRPLRGAPRLIPLISAIGASIFLQNAAQVVFGPKRRTYFNPSALTRSQGWRIPIGGEEVILTYTGVLTIVLSILLLLGLWFLVMKTRYGRSMRAVAENKQTAALMGINVDSIISNTFIISGALGGAAGVMWGIHNGIIYHYIGFIPGLKAFTAAVLGGIGNIPGAMVGGILLGIVESLGPAVLGIDFQLKDVIAFSILVLILIFRPSGLVGEVLTEEKV
ncbi:MAG: branched-chain amino acid ABC transporter permease [Anaerolineales bacterium]|nr:branched-chain amino acid ABC transporter permease [Anaerolineales bacterium]